MKNWRHWVHLAALGAQATLAGVAAAPTASGNPTIEPQHALVIAGAIAGVQWLVHYTDDAKASSADVTKQ